VEVPVTADTDVVVVGAGLAGLTAAQTLGRGGARLEAPDARVVRLDGVRRIDAVSGVRMTYCWGACPRHGAEEGCGWCGVMPRQHVKQAAAEERSTPWHDAGIAIRGMVAPVSPQATPPLQGRLAPLA
jgi:hypothetical protein